MNGKRLLIDEAEVQAEAASEARQAIENMVVEAVSLATGDPASVSKELVDGVVKLIFGIPRGERGEAGAYPDITEAVKGMVLTAGENSLPVWQEAPSGTPEVTAEDNGKFLRVVNGVWAAEALTNVAEEGA